MMALLQGCFQKAMRELRQFDVLQEPCCSGDIKMAARGMDHVLQIFGDVFVKFKVGHVQVRGCVRRLMDVDRISTGDGRPDISHVCSPPQLLS